MQNSALKVFVEMPQRRLETRIFVVKTPSCDVLAIMQNVIKKSSKCDERG